MMGLPWVLFQNMLLTTHAFSTEVLSNRRHARGLAVSSGANRSVSESRITSNSTSADDGNPLAVVRDLDAEFTFDLEDLPFEVRDLPFRSSTLASEGASSHWVKRGKPLLWVHIHKAAGSFMCMMAKRAGENIVVPNDGNCNWKLKDGYGQSGRYTPACQERASYFQSHGFTYGQVERELKDSDVQCAAHFAFGVMLREPVDLMHSNLNFNMKLFNGKGRQTINEFRLMLNSPSKEYAGPHQWPEWKVLDNYQTRLLADAVDVPAGGVTMAHLNKARERLASFQVVARVEDLRQSGYAMFNSLGWDGSSLARHIGGPRVNHQSHDVFSFTAEEVAFLRQVNHLDIQLHNQFAGGSYKPA